MFAVKLDTPDDSLVELLYDLVWPTTAGFSLAYGAVSGSLTVTDGDPAEVLATLETGLSEALVNFEVHRKEHA